MYELNQRMFSIQNRFSVAKQITLDQVQLSDNTFSLTNVKELTETDIIKEPLKLFTFYLVQKVFSFSI